MVARIFLDGHQLDRVDAQFTEVIQLFQHVFVLSSRIFVGFTAGKVAHVHFVNHQFVIGGEGFTVVLPHVGIDDAIAVFNANHPVLRSIIDIGRIRIDDFHPGIRL